MLKFHDESVVVGAIDPASLAAGSYNSNVIDLSKYHKVVFLVQTGVLGASATVDFGIYGDTASGGSFTTLVTGKSLTQIVKATGDNCQYMIEVNSNELKIQGFRYIRGRVTVAVAASIVGVMAVASDFNYGTGPKNAVATVKQIIS